MAHSPAAQQRYDQIMSIYPVMEYGIRDALDRLYSRDRVSLQSYERELQLPNIVSAIEAMSSAQVRLVQDYFGTDAGLEVSQFQRAIELFNNFDLIPYDLQLAVNNIRNRENEEVARIPVLRGPDSALAHARWYVFAEMAIALGIDAPFWEALRPVLLEGTAITTLVLATDPPSRLSMKEIAEVREKYTDRAALDANFLELLAMMGDDSHEHLPEY